MSQILALFSFSSSLCVRGVHGFLSLAGYYHKFIQGYGCIVKPLTALTKKDNFTRGLGTQHAFEQLKQVLISAPILQLLDFAQLFEIECDALGTGIGVVLMQNRHSIANFSKALSERNLAKSAYERGNHGLSPVLVVQQW